MVTTPALMVTTRRSRRGAHRRNLDMTQAETEEGERRRRGGEVDERGRDVGESECGRVIVVCTVGCCETSAEYPDL